MTKCQFRLRGISAQRTQKHPAKNPVKNLAKACRQHLALRRLCVQQPIAKKFDLENTR
jgi:hypothetical protein